MSIGSGQVYRLNRNDFILEHFPSLIFDTIKINCWFSNSCLIIHSEYDSEPTRKSWQVSGQVLDRDDNCIQIDSGANIFLLYLLIIQNKKLMLEN